MLVDFCECVVCKKMDALGGKDGSQRMVRWPTLISALAQITDTLIPFGVCLSLRTMNSMKWAA